MRKRLITLAAAMVFSLSVFAGCGGSTPAPQSSAGGSTPQPASSQPAPKAEEKKVVLRLADNQPEDYPTTTGDKEFAKLVGERTNGRVKIEVYAGAQLGQEKAVIEQVQFGAIDFARVSISPLAEFSPSLNALQLPYLYRNADHMWKVLEGPIGDKFLNSMENAKLIGLCWQDSGARNFYNSKKEIKSPADMKGLKIRVQESKLMMGLVSALGATPVPMAYGEVYSGLQTGVIDGAENNWPSYFTTSHYEVAKNLVIDEHTRVPEMIIASKMTLDKLSKEDVEVIKKAAKDSVKVQKEAWNKMEKDAEAKIKAAGNKITVLESNAEFQKAVAPLYDEFGKDYKDIIKQIQDTK